MTPEQARLMSRYSRWINERLYAACEGLPEATRREDRGAFFRSIHGTLNHLLLADRVWLGRFEQRPFAVRGLDQELYADFAELRAERAATDRRIEAWAASLTDEVLYSQLQYTSIVDAAPRSFPYRIAVIQFFNHQAHHRGQLTTLLSQCGIDYGPTDVIAMPDVMVAVGSGG